MNSFNWSCQADSAGSKTWSSPNPSWQRGDKIHGGGIGSLAQLCRLSAAVAHLPISSPCMLLPALILALTHLLSPSRVLPDTPYNRSCGAASSGTKEVTPPYVFLHAMGCFPLETQGRICFTSARPSHLGACLHGFVTSPSGSL